MKQIIPESVQKLINEFAKLPGIGPKSASRLTFYLLHKPENQVKNLGDAIMNLKNKIKKCPQCMNITDMEICLICADKRRDKAKILIVENPLDIIALEKTQEYNGMYFVLGGVISPVDGIGPDDIRIPDLIKKLNEEKNQVNEVIIATNPDLEGEATAMYIQKQIQNQIKNYRFKITRIARGLPVGGDLEYADEVTLSQALEGRKEY